MKATSRDRSVMAEINMIPLIDVALVVLIIFMVVSPMLVRMQLKLNLPTSQTAESAPDSKDVVEIGVEADGTIHFGDGIVDATRLEEQLRRALVSPEIQPVYVIADKATAFEHVVAVMDAAKRAGAVKLGVGARAPEAAAKRKSR